ncbi:MAG: fimbria/pilus outer membrane usher protein, partial [Pseudomonadota bacterium]|nr:fimbria/pilus outer membrane usher protein [Pseudomonadota bacterium]
MSRRSGAASYTLATGALLFVGLAGGAAPAPLLQPPSQPTSTLAALLLDVVVNGRRIGKVGEFQSRAGALYATRRELTELGLRPGAGEAAELVAVGSLPGVSERLDKANQTAVIDAAMASLLPSQLGAAAEHTDTAVESGVGAVLNYDVASSYAAGRSRVDTLLDGRFFSPWGVGSTQMLARAGGGSTRATRLDSTYTYSDADTLQRVRVGDVISSGLAWTRPIRLGGGQIARDFGLRPDLVTFPVPSIAGQVAVPSSVDILINGTQLLSAQADPGPFEFRQLPIVNGANNVALVVNNALGQQVTTTVPIYASSALLAPGLDAYSAEVGAVRLGFGFKSNDYRAAAGSASYRRGITNWLTLSGHAEASPSFGMAGGGAAMTLGSLAVGSIAVAGSHARGRHGILAYGAVERVTPTLSLSVSGQWTDGRYSDLAGLYDDPVPSRALRASAGYALGPAGTVGIAYTRQRRSTVVRAAVFAANTGGLQSTDPLTGPIFYLPSRTSLLSASYSLSLRFAGASFYATAFHDFANRSGTGALFGVTLPLGDRNTVGAGAGFSAGSATATVQASRSVMAVGDAGGQLYASRGGGDQRVFATGQYKSPWSLLQVSSFRSGGRTAWRASATGSVVSADGDFFASNLISDSFAIV